MDAVVIDEETITTLQDVMEDEFELLLETYLSDAPKRLAEIRQFFATGDMSEVEKSAHTLKGSSSNIGAPGLTQLCSDFLDMIRSGAGIDVEGESAKMEAEFEKVKAALTTYLN